jgi:protein-tyrosine phosphatase
MIDIHCHMLPGIDDGAATLEDALALAQACVEDGITHVVLTPHIFPGRFDNARSSIAAVVADFLAQPQVQQLPLRFSWAGEVRLSPEALDLLGRGELPCLGQSEGLSNMLLEMPDGQVPLGAMRLVHRLLAASIRPVIVHPERNRGVMEKPERLEPFIDAGCRVQITAGSLVGQFGARAQAAAAGLLERGWVHAVASDAHNTTGRRPRMREAAEWLTQHHGADVARRLTVLGPAELCGQSEAEAAAVPPQGARAAPRPEGGPPAGQ